MSALALPRAPASLPLWGVWRSGGGGVGPRESAAERRQVPGAPFLHQAQEGNGGEREPVHDDL